MKEECDARWLRRELLESIEGSRRAEWFAVDQRRSWWSFAHIWGALIVCFLCIYAVREEPLPVRLSAGILAVLFIGSRQNALGVRVHEGSHFLLFRNRAANDLICNWLAAYWVVTDIRSYRAVHWRHHQFLHEANDPDRELYLLPENGGRRAVLRFFLADLAGVTAVKRLRLLLIKTRAATEIGSGVQRCHLFGIVTVQGALLAMAIYFLGAWPGITCYLLFWFLPLATVYPFIIRLRTVTEHYAEELHHSTTRPFVSRTSLTDWLERYLIGADMEFHLEHHLNPAIPHYRLRKLNLELAKRGVFERLGEQKTRVLSEGYLKFWRRLIAAASRRGQPQ